MGADCTVLAFSEAFAFFLGKARSHENHGFRGAGFVSRGHEHNPSM